MNAYVFRINWILPLAFFLLGWGAAIFVIYDITADFLLKNQKPSGEWTWATFIFFSTVMIASAVGICWQSIVELTTKYDDEGISRFIKLTYRRIPWERVEKVEVFNEMTDYKIIGNRFNTYKARRVRIHTSYGSTLLMLHYYRDKYELLKLILDKTPEKAKKAFTIPDNLRDQV